MRGLYASVAKELLLLWRDKSALLVLFLMPSALVLITSLVMQRAMEISGDTGAGILLADEDGGQVSQFVRERLRESGFGDIVTTIRGHRADEASVKAATADGAFQIGLVIPKGTKAALGERSRWEIARMLSASDHAGVAVPPIPALVVYFDPAVQGNIRTIVTSILDRIALDLDIQTEARALSALLPVAIQRTFTEAMGPYAAYAPKGLLKGLALSPAWAGAPVLGVQEQPAFNSFLLQKPSSAQQNVPAWALFGMFFIVVPISGSIALERRSGTLARLLVAPASPLGLLAGKLLAYVAVSMVQFTTILVLATTLLPALGVRRLDMGSSPLAIMLIALCASLAAAGFGVFMGTACRTFEQASVLGPLLVVISAALGGIMVPLYIMPKLMQNISVFSPLGWGLRAFQEVLVRGGGVPQSLPWMGGLLAFCAVAIYSAWLVLRHRLKRGT